MHHNPLVFLKKGTSFLEDQRKECWIFFLCVNREQKYYFLFFFFGGGGGGGVGGGGDKDRVLKGIKTNLYKQRT